jgi:hypothetical protein
MGLLFRILKWLYLYASNTISSSLIDDPYEKRLSIGILNLLIILFWLVSWGTILFITVKVIGLEILGRAMLVAYIAALIWQKFSHLFTSFEQEFYLLNFTLTYTLIVGAAIQTNRMQWIDGTLLIFYWLSLAIVGFTLWRITVFNVTKATGVKSVSPLKKIEYKYSFRKTKMPKEIPSSNLVQAYLKKLK